MEADGLLFVQPEQGPVQELAGVADPTPEFQVPTLGETMATPSLGAR